MHRIPSEVCKNKGMSLGFHFKKWTSLGQYNHNFGAKSTAGGLISVSALLLGLGKLAAFGDALE